MKKQAQIPDFLLPAYNSLLPASKQLVSDWCTDNIMMVSPCPEPGPYRIERTPYIKVPLDIFGINHIEQINLLFGRQLAKTTLILNCIAYAVAEDPGPCLALFPDQVLAKSISKTRIQTHLTACPATNAKKPIQPDDFNIFEMIFPGMPIAVGWAGSGSQVMSRPVKILVADEIDEFKDTVGGGKSDPLASAKETTSNFIDRKIIFTSTPSTPEGNIWKELKHSHAIFEYWVPCQFCGEYQLLIWPQIKFESRDPEIVALNSWYECINPDCKKKIQNAKKLKMLSLGQWRTRKNAPECILKDIVTPYLDSVSVDDILEDHTKTKLGFHLPKWYSPFPHATFGQIAKLFLEAQGDFKKKRDWTKFNAAKPWVSVIKSKKYSELTSNIIDLPPTICPHDTVAVIMTIDPGQGGFWYTVVAWRPYATPHVIHYGFLSTWDACTNFINQHTYEIDDAGGMRLPIWRIGIDTGGSKYNEDQTMTEAAYAWLRKNRRNNLFGIKGDTRSKRGSRMVLKLRDKMPDGKPIPGGLGIWHIDVDDFKDVLHYRLELKKDEPGRLTFHNETNEDFFKSILAEEKQRDDKGNYYWKPIRSHNHYMDDIVYNIAFADPECHGGVMVLKPPVITQNRTQEKEKRTGWLKGVEGLMR